MKNKLLSLLAGSLLTIPAVSFAVGLGSVRTYSHLNEKLRAEIPVLSVKKKGQMTVSLAPNAEFSKRGVRRDEILSDLNFSLSERKGRMYVNVSSKKQIAVPYLNFILRLNTPEGIVSREYAIFLDPVSGAKKKAKKTVTTKKSRNSHDTSAAINSPYRTRKGQNTVKQTSKTSKSAAFNVANARGGRYGPIRRGETLWSIAAHTRPSANVPVRDMVRAIRRANPRTLANGLPAGVTINIPTLDGYQAYRGGYAPLPEKTTKKKPTRKRKVKTTKKRNTDVAGNKKSKTKKRPQKDSESGKVARPSIPVPPVSESESETLVQTTSNEETLVQPVPKETLGEKAENIFDDTKDALGNAAEAVAETTGDVVDGTKNALGNAAEVVAETTGDVVDGTKNALGNAAEVVAETTSDVVEGTKELTTDAAQAVDEALTPSEEPLAETETTTKEVQTTVTKVEEPVKPVVESKPNPTPAPVVAQIEEPSLVDTVIDNAPIIGGGAAVAAGLGWLFFRRRRNKDNGEVALTDEDMATLMGEEELSDDIDTLRDFDDDFIDDHEEAVSELPSDIEALDELIFDEDDDDLDDVFITDETQDNTMLDPDLDDDLFADLDSDEATDLDELLAADEVVENTAATIEQPIDLNVDEELSFNLDDDKDLIGDVDLDGALALELEETEVNPLEFDLTAGDDDLVFDDKELDLTASDDDGGFDFSLDSLKESIADKTEDFVETVSDKKDDVVEAFSEKKASTGLALSGFADDVKEAVVGDDVSPEQASRMQMKLDLANSFLSISENSRAKELLEEVVQEGSREQAEAARKALEDIS